MTYTNRTHGRAVLLIVTRNRPPTWVVLQPPKELLLRISQLATTANLKLAWRRITTGGNHQYKCLFRHLYVAYEVALDENIEDLRMRIIGGTFRPKQPERIYLPKNSGLHRPLSLRKDPRSR